jgi:hypothetical protein
MKTFWAATLGCVVLASPAAQAAALQLTALKGTSTFPPVNKAAIAASLTDPQIVRGQSYTVKRGDVVVGTLVSGSGTAIGDIGSPYTACFAALVAPDPSHVSLVTTIGGGQWKSDTCQKLDEIGVVSAKDAPDRIGVLYTIVASERQPEIPIVLALDDATGTLSVDADASAAAWHAHATSLAGIRRALRKEQ